jgi:hypothetical protein
MRAVLSVEFVARDDSYIFRRFRLFVEFEKANSAFTILMRRRQHDHISRHLITSTIPFIYTYTGMP